MRTVYQKLYKLSLHSKTAKITLNELSMEYIR